MYINDKVLKTILTDFRQRVESKDEDIKSLIKDTVSISVVEALPETGEAGTLYVVGTDSTGYTMSVYSNNKFVTISGGGGSAEEKEYVVVSSTVPSTVVDGTLYVVGTKSTGYELYIGVSGEAINITPSASGLNYKVVSALPSTGEADTLYFAGTEAAGYEVAVYDNGKWVKGTKDQSLTDEEVQSFITELWA